MSATSELNAAVAEQVMGWHQGEGEDRNGYVRIGWLDQSGNWAESIDQFSPSQFIEDAWVVLLKSIKDGATIELSAVQDSDGIWAEAWLPHNFHFRVNAIDKSLCSVLCKVLVKAYRKP